MEQKRSMPAIATDPAKAGKYNSTTPEIARGLRIQPHALHASLCRRGHYFGIVPIKAPNGRLLWPDDTLDRLLGGRS